MSEAEVVIDVSGSVGRVTLNRPRALNALTADMVHAIDQALSAWEHDPEVRCVLLDGSGERGLCAGGDIRAIYDAALAGDPHPKHFWRDEYRLNARINRYPKPYIALMDGVVMGGGVGVSAHGSIRIVTERTRVAMPEVGIGFVPDVGGTYLLSRAPGELGTHAALTTAQLGPSEALLCGLADYFVASTALPHLIDGVLDASPVCIEEVVLAHAKPPPASELIGHRRWIDECYAAGSVEEFVRRLQAAGSEAAREAVETIATKSPTALKVT